MNRITSCIYMILFDNNMCYIGKSDAPYLRFYKHISLLKSNRHGNRIMQQAYNEGHFKSIDFAVVREVDRDVVSDWEKFYIFLYNKTAYNIMCNRNYKKTGKSERYMNNKVELV